MTSGRAADGRFSRMLDVQLLLLGQVGAQNGCIIDDRRWFDLVSISRGNITTISPDLLNR